MYDFFTEGAMRNRGAATAPYFLYVREGMVTEIAKVIGYYRERSLVVRNDHLLVRLLKHLNVSMNRDLRNYADTASDRLASVSRVMQITSAVNVGKVIQPGEFYGDNPEIIIADDTEFDYEEAMKDWKNLEPIKVHRHPFTDMSVAVPAGEYKGSNEKGLIVLSVHFAKLAIQYRGWYMSERSQADGSTESMAQFVRRYPVTNLVRSHMDVALFNRLAALKKGALVAPYNRVNPVYQIDYSSRIDAALQKYIDNVLGTQRTFEEYLLNLPSFRGESMLETFALPRVVPTRQVEWALVLARLPLIFFLLSVGGDKQHPANRQYLNRIKETLWAIRNDRGIANIVPPGIFREFKVQSEAYINPYLWNP